MPSRVSAQGGYFGRNKVQYQAFNFKVLKTDHFDIYYYPEEEDAARMASRLAERWYTRLAGLFDHQLHNRQPLVLYASGPHFRQTNVIEGQLGEGTGGVTEAAKRRIVLPLAGPIESTDHVLGHELVHAFQYDITNTTANSGPNSALSLPLWFIEGMAEYLSIGPVDPHTAMWMREATRRETLPDIDHLDDPKYSRPLRRGILGVRRWEVRRPGHRESAPVCHRARRVRRGIQESPRRGLERTFQGMARCGSHGLPPGC